jgi:Leucine-rich repeat (LRR) protein
MQQRERRKLITEDLLLASAKQGQSRPRNSKEPAAKAIGRQTHIHLNGKRLTSSVMPAGAYPLLKVLYLFDNEIEQLEGLGSLSQLTHLYAQNNLIASIGGDVGQLGRLRKLYVSNNRLASLAPLAPLYGLEELHAASQKLDEGEAFDPAGEVLASMLGLRVLDLANNGLENAAALAQCASLTSCNLSRNPLGSLDAVAPLLAAAPLGELDLRGCPVSDARQSLDAMIVACPPLSKLNGRELTPAEKQYLDQLHRRGKRAPIEYAGGMPPTGGMPMTMEMMP